ncbi:MAG TPA: hypothetical protein DD632_03140 [Oribacterium sp.]|nr:hypothetical protein [Oribacterium sp.]
MAFIKDKITEYSGSPYVGHIPGEIKAMGELNGTDGKRLLTIAFTTRRDLVSDIGVTAEAACSEELKAAAAAGCALAKGKAIMAVDLLTPEDILKPLSDETEPADSEYFVALMALMAIKNALASYAAYRSAENGKG